MQAQKPPQMPQLHSQLQRNQQQQLAVQQPQPATQQKEHSFVRNTLPSFIMLSALAGICVLGWYAYEEATTPRNMTDLPVITSENTPYKIKPSDEGGIDIPNLDKQVYNTIAGVEKDEPLPEEIKTVTSAEEPIDRELIKQLAQTDPQEEFSEEETISKSENTPVPANSQEPAEIMEENITEQAVATDATEATKIKKTPLPVPDYYLTDEVENAIPTKKPVPVGKPEAVEAKKTVAAEPVKEVVKSIPPPASMNYNKQANNGGEKPASATANKPTSISGIKIQLGAFRSTDEVKSVWDNLQKKNYNLLGNVNYSVEKADLGSKGVFYRLHAGPFGNRDEASITCKQLIAKGQGCFVVK